MNSGSFSAKIVNGLKRLERNRREAETVREEKFADTVNVYRDLRNNGNNKIIEFFRRRNRARLFFAAALFFAIILHRQTGLSLIFSLVVCVPVGVFLAHYNERLRVAAKKRPILRHYD